MRVLLVLFALMVALSAVPLGSNRDWAWSPLGGLVGILLIGMALAAMFDREWRNRTFSSFHALLVPAALFALVLAWALLQMSGWTPADWATALSASPVLPGNPSRSITFDSERQWTALMRLLTYGGMFVLAAALGQQASGARRILATIIVVASLTTIYAMAAQAINSQSRVSHFSVWVPHGFFFSGSFVNSNNYATYAGVSMLAALALAFRPAARSDRRETDRERWRRRLAVLSGMSGLWFALALVLGMGVMLSGSRGGAASLALALVAMSFFYARRSNRFVVAMLILLAMLVIVILSPSGARLVEKTGRLISEGGESGREAVYPKVLDAIALRPMTGWGMGSFGQIFGFFQPVTDSAYFYSAHCTYLELAFDLGVPAACALLLAVAWIVSRCIVGFATRGRNRELAGLGVLATVLAGFHALFDFSLEIPAFASTYFAILGVAWAQSWSSEQQ
jgi:O-antigen ligase